MATVEETPAAFQGVRIQEQAKAREFIPVKWWAGFGALALAFIVFVWAKWITGPYFETVPSGPSDPPTWMSTTLDVWQVVGVFVALGFLYWFLVRPWVRDGVPSTDGLLCVACFFLYFQDPLGNFYSHWFTYNTSLVQFGSWVNEIPGWESYGEPGRMLSEPVVFTGAFYVWAFFGLAVAGSAAMRWAKSRWPQLGTLGLMMVAFAVCAFGDLVLEGLVMMPLGAYVYGGSYGPMLFAGSYHQFPIFESVFAGALFAGLAWLRYFRNDRGETIAERGIDKLRVGRGTKTLVKFLALVGATQAIMLVLYNLPVAGWVAPHQNAWPKSIQERSYFTSYVCGAGTDRLCPGPNTPIDRGSTSPHIGPGGRVVVQEGGKLPGIVPFDVGKPGD
jgi:Spirocyclase AveC-like